MMQSRVEILRREQEAAGVRDTIGQNAYRLLAPGLNGDVEYVGVFVSLSKLRTMTNEDVYEQVIGLGRRLYVVTGLDYDDTMSISAIEISGVSGLDELCTRNVADFIAGRYRDIDEPTWLRVKGQGADGCVCVCGVRLRGNFDNLIEEDWAFQEIIDELVA